MFSLIFAGEAIFSLPFHVARFFRATVLDVFQFSNANLGDVFAVYGITAMLAYFPGGAIADRYSPRKLMSLSLFATAAGGIYMATIPSMLGMSVLFAYWGVTSILLFWAAMIRGTREWGGTLAQGRAFGILDGGRGLVAAALASFAVIWLKHVFSDGSALSDPATRGAELTAVIYFYTAVTFCAGLLTFVFIPDAPAPSRPAARRNIRTVLSAPLVWAQALIVVCAYCGYKGLDNFALYAVEVLGMSDIEAAKFTATCAYLRPVAAVAAGLLADRFRASRIMLVLFCVMMASHAYLAQTAPAAGLHSVLFGSIFLSFAGVYALRGVYFALLGETKVPAALTGTSVGLISLVGYTPDVFFAAIAGRLLDNAPGLAGHQHYFMFLSAIMILGAIATVVLIKLAAHPNFTVANVETD